MAAASSRNFLITCQARVASQFAGWIAFTPLNRIQSLSTSKTTYTYYQSSQLRRISTMNKRGRVSDSSDSGRSDSSINTDTSGSTASSEADRFRDTLEGLMVGEIPNDDLVKRANKLIESLAGRPNPNEFAPRWYRRCTTKVNKILEAMLVFSPQCGGEEGQRYVACAIIACTVGSKSSEGTHADLTDLAISWFSNFLWICKFLLWWPLYIKN